MHLLIHGLSFSLSLCTDLSFSLFLSLSSSLFLSFFLSLFLSLSLSLFLGSSPSLFSPSPYHTLSLFPLYTLSLFHLSPALSHILSLPLCVSVSIITSLCFFCMPLRNNTTLSLTPLNLAQLHPVLCSWL